MPGFRDIHVGFHTEDVQEPWTTQENAFFDLVSQHHPEGQPLHANVYISHPETNNGLSIQIEPHKRILTRRIHQSNQIIGGRGGNLGHWKSGARICKMPASAVQFTKQVLDILGISYTHGKDDVTATYLHKPHTGVSHIQELHSFALEEGREFSADVYFNRPEAPLGPHVGRVSLADDPEFGHKYLGVSFGEHGSSEWDQVPLLSPDKIAIQYALFQKFHPGAFTDWAVDSCHGKDRGKKAVSYTHLTLPTIYSV